MAQQLVVSSVDTSQQNNAGSRMRGKVRILLVLLLMAVMAGSGYALLSETLPTYHWTYGVIEELQLRGSLTSLNLSERPLTRGQVARAIIDEADIENAKDRGLIDLLRREFASEIADLQPTASMVIKEAVEKVISPSGLVQPPPFKGKVGIRLQGDWMTRQHTDPRIEGIAIAQAGVEFRPNVAAHGRLRLDSQLRDDPTYEGRVWRGLAGYAEAGYLRLGGRVFNVQLGRDRFTIGSGKHSHLLLSDVSLPLDALWFSASLKGFRYSFLTAQLDTMLHSDYPDEVLQRYLAIHRIWVQMHPRLSIGLSEAVIYGGPNRTFELQFLNPFLYWHGEVLNRNGPGNIFVMLDVDWLARDGMEFYGELLIDDLQIEKKIPKDLEPSEIGWIAGSRFTDLPLIPDAVFNLEYMGVTNRTYNSMNPYEKYLHSGLPLGSDLGNDFDRWMISTSQWIRKDLQCTLSVSFLRKGEGSIAAPFDTSYLQYTVEEGYDEPFPTGTVQKETTLSVGVFIIPTYATWLQLETGMTWFSNQAHQAGSDDEQIWSTLSLVLELDHLVGNGR